MAYIDIPTKDNNTPLTPTEFNYLVDKLNARRLRDLIDVEDIDAAVGQSIQHNGSGWVMVDIKDTHYTKDEINNLLGLEGEEQFVVNWGEIGGSISAQSDLFSTFGALATDNVWSGTHTADNYILTGSNGSSSLDFISKIYTTDGTDTAQMGDGDTLTITGAGVSFDNATNTFTIAGGGGGGTWETITGDQSVINNSGFTNDSGWITAGNSIFNNYALLTGAIFTGNVTAVEFHGDGSNLTGVLKNPITLLEGLTTGAFNVDSSNKSEVILDSAQVDLNVHDGSGTKGGTSLTHDFVGIHNTFLSADGGTGTISFTDGTHVFNFDTAVHATEFHGDGSNLTGLPSSGISHATSDGQEYVSKNGAWVVATGGGGSYLPLAGGTLTGKLYGKDVELDGDIAITSHDDRLMIGTTTKTDFSQNTMMHLLSTANGTGGRASFRVESTSTTSASNFGLYNNNGNYLSFQAGGSSYATGEGGSVSCTLPQGFQFRSGVASGNGTGYDIEFLHGGWYDTPNHTFYGDGTISFGRDINGDSRGTHMLVVDGSIKSNSNIHATEFHGDGSNLTGIATGSATWETMAGDQSTVNLSGFTNDAGFVTDLSGYALKSATSVNWLGKHRFGYGTGSYTFEIDANHSSGPRLNLGTQADSDSFFAIGAWSSINNFDSKGRDLKLYSGTSYLYFDYNQKTIGVHKVPVVGRALDVDGNVHATEFHGDGSNLTNVPVGSHNHTGVYLPIAGKAADTTLCDGLVVGTGRNNTANQIVRTNGSGYLEAGWINTSSGATTNAVSDVYVNTNDGYIRKKTLDLFREELGVTPFLHKQSTPWLDNYSTSDNYCTAGDFSVEHGDRIRVTYETQYNNKTDSQCIVEYEFFERAEDSLMLVRYQSGFAHNQTTYLMIYAYLYRETALGNKFYIRNRWDGRAASYNTKHRVTIEVENGSSSTLINSLNMYSAWGNPTTSSTAPSGTTAGATLSYPYDRMNFTGNYINGSVSGSAGTANRITGTTTLTYMVPNNQTYDNEVTWGRTQDELGLTGSGDSSKEVDVLIMKTDARASQGHVYALANYKNGEGLHVYSGDMGSDSKWNDDGFVATHLGSAGSSTLFLCQDGIYRVANGGGGGGISHATSDGNAYSSQNGAWKKTRDDSQTYEQLVPTKSTWLRSPASGFLPDADNGAALGTSDWNFSSSYIRNMYTDNLRERVNDGGINLYAGTGGLRMINPTTTEYSVMRFGSSTSDNDKYFIAYNGSHSSQAHEFAFKSLLGKVTFFAGSSHSADVRFTVDSAKVTSHVDFEVEGWYGREENEKGGLMGGYNNDATNSNYTNPIYIIGSAYKPNATTLNNMYGIGYCNGSASFLNGTDLGTTPASKWGMYVASDGNARIFLNAGEGIGHFKGRVYAADFYENSDRKLKKDIKSLGNGLFSYVLKADANETLRYGTIAQEIEKELPEVVDTDSEGNKTVNYTSLLTKKLSEANERIEQLEAKIELILKELL